MSTETKWAFAVALVPALALGLFFSSLRFYGKEWSWKKYGRFLVLWSSPVVIAITLMAIFGD